MLRAPNSPTFPDSPPLSAFDDRRLEALRRWLAGLADRHGLSVETLRPASDDASFRRYFRVEAAHRALPGLGKGDPTLIVMDAPPPREDCRPFVHAAAVLAQAGLRVPAVIEADLERGFLLLEDFGSQTLLDRLALGPAEADIERLYRGASQALVTMQAASRPGVFPDYDRELLERELMLFPDWYLGRHLGIGLSDSERNALRRTFDLLLTENLAQPRVFVHRDYHSRNLMVLGGDDSGNTGSTDHRESTLVTPGIIDFQDAVYGPITYDLVSLLRDAYISWPEERQIDWAVRWWQSARSAGLPVPEDFGELWRSFEWMGLQRHLKVLGIFARLWHRDGKRRYLADLPQVLAGTIEVAKRYDAFSGLLRLIERSENRAARQG